MPATLRVFGFRHARSEQMPARSRKGRFLAWALVGLALILALLALQSRQPKPLQLVRARSGTGISYFCEIPGRKVRQVPLGLSFRRWPAVSRWIQHRPVLHIEKQCLVLRQNRWEVQARDASLNLTPVEGKWILPLSFPEMASQRWKIRVACTHQHIWKAGGVTVKWPLVLTRTAVFESTAYFGPLP